MSEKTRSEYSFLNIVSGIGGYFLNLLVGFVCRMVFARVLSAEHLGVGGLFNDILGVLALAELGIGSAIGFALYEPLAKGNMTKVATLVNFYKKCYLTIGLVVVSIGLGLMPFLDFIIKDKPDIDENIYVLYLIYLANASLTYFFSYRTSLIIAAQKSYVITIVSNITAFIQNILQIVSLLLWGNFILYLLIKVVGVLVSDIFSFRLAKKLYPDAFIKNPPPMDKQEKSTLIRNVRALAISRIGGVLVNSTDNIIITYFSSLASAGLKGNYTFITSNIGALLVTVFNGLTASIGNHNALESKENKLAMFKSINLANFWLYAWSAIGFFVVSSDFVSVFFGPEYTLPLEIPAILAINYYMYGMQNAVWAYYNTSGLFRHGRYMTWITAVVNLVVSIILGKFFGLFGVLLATAIARGCTSTWYSPYAVFKYVFELPFRIYLKRYIGYFIILVGTGALCLFICSFINFSAIVNFFLKFIVCCIVPNLVFFLFYGRSEEFRTLKGFAIGSINKVLKKLKIKRT